MILRKPTVMLNDLANVFNNLEELDYEYIDAGSQIWVVDNFLPVSYTHLTLPTKA